MKSSSLVLAALASGCASFAPDQAPATPQRPTLSSSTATTAVGTIEVEAGAVLDHNDSYALPTAVKWGASERTELFTAWSPWVLFEAPGSDPEGASDLQLGVRHRFADATPNLPALAVQMTSKLATANAQIGTGQNDVFVAAIADQQFNTVGVTGFYQLGVLGNTSGRGTDLQHDVALAAGTAVNREWGIFGEIAGTFIPDLNVDAVFTTGGFTFTPRPHLVFDCGVVVGLNHDAPDVQLVFGCTYNLGRLFDWSGE